MIRFGKFCSAVRSAPPEPGMPPAIRSVCAPHFRRRVRAEGYALLTVIFLAGVMIIAAAISLPILVTQGKREKEEELIWRGEQHVRAVKLYYRKTGRFPKDITDLTKAFNGIHFLRKPFKDPMNTEDGTWRFIYVGPGGQLVGSVTRTSLTGIPTLAQIGQTANKPPTPATPGQPGPFSPLGDVNSVTGDVGTGQNEPDTTPLPPPPAPPKTGNPAAGTAAQGPVFGGNLIGVASKVDKPSIKFYNGYGKYKEWEFIWDPQAEAAAAAGISYSGPLAAPTGAQPSPSPQPGAPLQPTQPSPNPP